MIKKLSKPQQEVIDLMKAGWELGASGGMSNRTWLQRDGCGRGGPVKEVNGNTFYALVRRGLIKGTGTSWPSIWVLASEQS